MSATASKARMNLALSIRPSVQTDERSVCLASGAKVPVKVQ